MRQRAPWTRSSETARRLQRPRLQPRTRLSETGKRIGPDQLRRGPDRLRRDMSRHNQGVRRQKVVSSSRHEMSVEACPLLTSLGQVRSRPRTPTGRASSPTATPAWTPPAQMPSRSAPCGPSCSGSRPRSCRTSAAKSLRGSPLRCRPTSCSMRTGGNSSRELERLAGSWLRTRSCAVEMTASNHGRRKRIVRRQLLVAPVGRHLQCQADGNVEVVEGLRRFPVVLYPPGILVAVPGVDDCTIAA